MQQKFLRIFLIIFLCNFNIVHCSTKEEGEDKEKIQKKPLVIKEKVLFMILVFTAIFYVYGGYKKSPDKLENIVKLAKIIEITKVGDNSTVSSAKDNKNISLDIEKSRENQQNIGSNLENIFEVKNNKEGLKKSSEKNDIIQQISFNNELEKNKAKSGDYFESLKSKIPDANRIEEVRQKIVSFDFNKQNYQHSIYIKYQKMLSEYNAPEVFCAIIKHASEAQMADDYITKAFTSFPMHANFYNVVDEKQKTESEKLLFAHTLGICLSYCFLENTENRLELFLRSLEKWPYDTGILLYFDQWCQKAIDEDNSVLLDFCKSYIEIILKKDNYVSLKFLNFNRATSIIFLHNLHSLIIAMPDILQKLKIKKDINLIEWHDNIVQNLFKNLAPMYSKNTREIINNILFLSKKFENEFYQRLFGGDIDDYNTRLLALDICNTLTEMEKSEIYEKHLTKIQHYIDDKNKDVEMYKNTCSFVNILYMYSFLCKFANADNKKKLQLIKLLPVILEKLLKTGTGNYDTEGNIEWNIIDACATLDLYTLEYNHKLQLHNSLCLIIDQINQKSYDKGTFFNICFDVYKYLLVETDIQKNISAKRDTWNMDIAFLIKKLLINGEIDFNTPPILTIDGISVFDLFKNYFNKKDDYYLHYNNLVGCFKYILKTDDEIEKATAFINYFNIKIPFGLKKIKVLLNQKESLWKRFLLRNSNNFVEKRSGLGVFGKLIRTFKKNDQKALVKLGKYYDFFVEFVNKNNINIHPEKSYILEYIFTLLDNPCDDLILKDIKELFVSVNCSFNTIFFRIKDKTKDQQNNKLSEMCKKFYAFLFSYVVSRKSDKSDKIKCLKILINAFKNNQYKINKLGYGDMKDSFNERFYQAFLGKKISLLKMILFNVAQEQISGYDKKTGFSIFHESIIQHDVMMMREITAFLIEQQKINILKNLLETKADPQCGSGFGGNLKSWKDKTPLQRVQELIQENKEKIDECNYHGFATIPKNITGNYNTYSEMKNILTFAQSVCNDY